MTDLHQSHESQRGLPSALVPGLILVAAGLFFLLNNLGVFHIHDLVRYWPAILIVIGLSQLLDPNAHGGRTGGAIFTCVGAWWLAHNLGWMTLGFRDLWPLVLILIGLVMLRDRLWPWDGAGTPDSPVLMENAFMGGGKRTVVSDDFKGGTISAMMGGIELDLRRAVIRGASATITIRTLMGGVEIRIPDNWNVVIHGNGVLGGIDDESSHPDPVRPEVRTLILETHAVMGGVSIKN